MKMLQTVRIFTGTILLIFTGNVLADEIMTLPMGLLIEAIEPYAINCDPKPKLEHAQELFLNKEDAQHTTKCLRRCLMDQFELFIDGGTQVNSDKLVGYMLLAYPEKMEDLNEISNSCNEQNEEMGIDEKCEVAHVFGMCMLKEMQSREYEIPKVVQ